MNRLVAIELPSSAVASSVASTKSQASAPAAASTESLSVLAGKARSGCRVKSPVMVCVRVDDGARGAGLEAGQRIGAGADDEVAAEQQVGAARAQAHGVQGLGEAPMRTWLITAPPFCAMPSLVEHGGGLAFDMRGHAQDRADGDDAGAADAGDQHAVGLVGHGRQRRARRQRRLGRRSAASCRPCPCRTLPPSTVTKLGQKPLRQEKSLLQDDWSMARLRPNSVSTGVTLTGSSTAPSNRRSPRRPPG